MTSEGAVAFCASSFSLSGEGSWPQVCFICFLKEHLSSRGQQKSREESNKGDLGTVIQGCSVPSSMAHLFGDQTLSGCHMGGGFQPRLFPSQQCEIGQVPCSLGFSSVTLSPPSEARSAGIGAPCWHGRACLAKCIPGT